jgi:trk system potassium uptake protein
MYVIIVGGGKVGANVGRALTRLGHEVTILEVRRNQYVRLESEFEQMVHYGDGTEIFVLEEAGIARADACIAVTGDDEDNIIICQVAREKFGVQHVVARVNDPRNQEHFDLLNIAPTVCSTTAILSLIEHEVPQHSMVHLLSLQRENIEIVELQLDTESPAVGRSVSDLELPEGSLIVTVLRDRTATIASPELVLAAGDQVIAIVKPDQADELAELILAPSAG